MRFLCSLASAPSGAELVDEPASLTEVEVGLLRRAIELARDARAHGNHPFGSLIADGAGRVLIESENKVVTLGDDTAHAELLLASMASRQLSREQRNAATLYTSTEPCAMCAGAMYWSGIGRLVYAMSEADLLALTGDHEENPTMQLGCRAVLAGGQHTTLVLGPNLVDEAILAHEGFWS